MEEKVNIFLSFIWQKSKYVEYLYCNEWFSFIMLDSLLIWLN